MQDGRSFRRIVGRILRGENEERLYTFSSTMSIIYLTVIIVNSLSPFRKARIWFVRLKYNEQFASGINSIFTE